jgi:hypothetical protein
LSKRIGWLNNNANLNQPLRYDEAGALLENIDTKDAMDILKDLEEKAADIRDPTGWVKVAAQKRLGGGGGLAVGNWGATTAMGAVKGVIRTGMKARTHAATPEEDQKIRKRIGWMNANAGLQGPLMYDKASTSLLALPSMAAMEILKNLEEKAAEVRDPTGYVIAAAKRRIDSGGMGPVGGMPMTGFGGMGMMAMPMMPMAPMMPMGSADPGFDEKLRKRVGWLNNNANLAQPLMYNKVKEALSVIDSRKAMDILKDLEGKGAEIRDPTGWVAKAPPTRVLVG